MNYISWFSDCNYDNKNLVGGKNASLGELYKLSQQVNFNISNGFAITTELYSSFIETNNIKNIIYEKITSLNCNDINEIDKVSDEIKNIIYNSNFTDDQIKSIKYNYNHLSKVNNIENLSVAVRSSAIAEDLPNASFAGQQDTYLNICGIDNLILSVKKCYASLFNSRAISYRNTHNINMEDVLISVGIQKMIRSDIGSAGVAFSIDPETGYNKAVIINSAFGLGELVVSGGVKPDEFIVDKRVLKDINCDPIISKKLGNKNNKIIYSKDGIQEISSNLIEKVNFSLSNMQIVELSRVILSLEKEYKKMFKENTGIDVEWALDGTDNKLYIIQVRPETVHSNNTVNKLVKYSLVEDGDILIEGVPVGEKISTGCIKKLNDISEYNKFNKGDILLTDMTTPDWEPIMKISSGIITNKGGRTCHAAIVARELQVNAIVGCGNATDILEDNQSVTMSCADGRGIIYKGILEYEKDSFVVKVNNNYPIKFMLNVATPELSFTSSMLPNKGVGLARLEFIITNYIKIHPIALCNYPNIRDDIKKQIYNIIGNHDNGKWFFIKRLARGIAHIASAFYPENVVVRLSDFKSNEYRNLIGGELYEPFEENPMIGWRGASRYYSEYYKKGFELECLAIKYARDSMNMSNIIVMIPFCRTPDECKLVIDIMKSHGLERGVNGMQIYLMCEIPSNVIEADKFSEYIDGVSIGGNDLLQLTLGVDRDSEKIASLSNHRNLSYRRMIQKAINDYKEHNVKVGFCGQQPSDSIDFCKFLINEGIDSISVTPDSMLKTLDKLS